MEYIFILEYLFSIAMIKKMIYTRLVIEYILYYE